MRKLERLQWYGLLAAPLAWAVQLVVGFGAADASCAPAGSRWGISVETWMIALTAVAAVVALSAELSAASLYRRLRGVAGDAAGPSGRLRFFSVAALVGNVLFLGLIALTAAGSLTHLGCGR